MQKRPEVAKRNSAITIPESLREWIGNETKLGNPALKARLASAPDDDLALALEWSERVNSDIEAMVHGVPPFPNVREALEKLAPHADMLVVSATPNAALKSEWEEHDIARFVTEICGQESGSKKETLANASQYPAEHTLMIGDAPGDHRAAEANRSLFFPINPGAEEASWQRFVTEGIDRFLNGTFAGAYQQTLLDEFEKSLPSSPPWPVVS